MGVDEPERPRISASASFVSRARQQCAKPIALHNSGYKSLSSKRILLSIHPMYVSFVCSDADYMLALALQQEDASALASAAPTQPDLAGDEAVAMALLNEDRALLEQRTAGGNDDTTLVAGRHGVPSREDRDRFVGQSALRVPVLHVLSARC